MSDCFKMVVLAIVCKEGGRLGRMKEDLRGVGLVAENSYLSKFKVRMNLW